MKSILVCIFSLLIFGCNPLHPLERSKSRVKIGQVWEWCPENPFREHACRRYKIIDIRGDYVQYMNIKSGDIDSSTIYLFLAGSKLIN